MISQIEKLKAAIEPFRKEVINHKVYSEIKDVDDLKVFMQFHVYAVWDFMSLLKTLQNNLTCNSVPWYPKGSADTRHIINTIVAEEEADVDLNGVRKSHFELYLDAMSQCGADTSQINSFISEFIETGDFNQACHVSGTPEEAGEFVEFTFDVISGKKEYLQSAVFTFGREDLIPGMFYSLINDVNGHFPGNFSIFKYYLKRHIRLGGDHHSRLAMQMTAELCGNNEQCWKEAEDFAIKSLQKRINLWDGVYRAILENRRKR